MTEKDKKVTKYSAIAMAVGNAAGLTYAFMKKKQFCGYVGYFFLFGLITGTATWAISEALIKENK